MQVVTDAQPPQDGPSAGGWEPVGPPVVTGRQLRELLADDAWLDELIELADHLGYERGDPAGRGSPNSRNGSIPKTLATEVGPVPMATPRDRAGSFEPRLVRKGQRRLGGLDEIIISLYAGGMTVRDIAAHLQRTLGTELSHDTISKITDAVLEEVKAWQTRPLDEVYPIVYLDALNVKVRDGHQVRNKAAHLAVGVDLDGVKAVLGIWVRSTEGAKFWAGVCAELANRGARHRGGLLRRAARPTRGDRGDLAHQHRADLRGAPDPGLPAFRQLSGPQEGRRAALRAVYTAPTAEAAETELLAFADT